MGNRTAGVVDLRPAPRLNRPSFEASNTSLNTAGIAEQRTSPCVEQSIGFNFGPANGNTQRFVLRAAAASFRTSDFS